SKDTTVSENIQLNFYSRVIDYNVLKRIEKIADESWNRDKTELWKQLIQFFDALDKGLPPRIHKFNGGLFRTNKEIDELVIKDVLLKKLLQLNDYDFESDLSVNILGHIFEQSITDIERIKQELIESKDVDYSETDNEISYKSPISETNKRKKEGIFYTPEQVTRYIVSNAVGSWLEKKKDEIGINSLSEFPKTEAEKEQHLKLWQSYRNTLSEIKILDPACGSGAFLTQAFDFLLKEQTMVLDVMKKLNGEKQEVKITGLFSTAPTKKDEEVIKLKKSIVNNNLFGVDLNYESVEITKLGLWLKSASKNDELALLDDNIKCGNSLINDKSVTEKAFDWNNEFKDILKNSGFDIIIGNPPYIRPHNIPDNEKVYLWNNFEVAQQKTDIYAFFIEKSIKLLKSNSILSFIVPKTWFSIYSFEKLRKYVLENSNIQLIGNLPTKVFEDAVVETTIIQLERSSKVNKGNLINISDVYENSIIKTIEQEEFTNHPNYNITTLNQSKIWENTVKLGDITDIIVGIATGDDKKYCRFEKLTEIDKPAIRGANVSRYFIDYKGEYLWYDREQMIADSMLKPKSSLKAALGQCSPKQPSDFEIPEKIVMQRIAKRIIAALDKNQYYAHTSLVIIKPSDNNFDLKYILAVLNSELIDYWLKANTSNVSLNVGTIKNIPIKNISKENQKSIVLKVEKINNLTQKLHKQKNSFIEVVKSQLNVGKINRKIENWYELEWSEFNKELEKLKIKLDLKKTKEWNEFFTPELESTKPLVFEINNLIDKINKEIYEMYEIEPNELKTSV
ncbi:MAG: N-6 DNA methylase, partial [Bacteroidales bacterium]|nr:N-6 DNA methylase [Bacteroidales bacterium]